MSKSLAENEDIIWHYTSREVFANILEKRTGLYATHYKFLNDSSEYKYGLDVVMDYLIEEINKRINEQLQQGVTEEKRKEFNQIKEDLNCEKIELPYKDMFTLCFSRKPDKLYQWRSYTPNGGYSIGFSKSELDLIIQKKSHKSNEGDKIYFYNDEDSNETYILLEDCIYDKEAMKNCIETLVFQKDNMKSIARLFSLSKHYSFREEEETRIAIFGDSLRRHIEIVGGKPRIPIVGCDKDSVANLIKGVYVSPHGDREGNMLFAELLKEKHNLSFEICCSDSPYVGG